MGKAYKIALLLEKSRYYGRELIEGIAKYSRLFGPWSFYSEDRFYFSEKRENVIPFLKKWGVDGIITRDHEGVDSLLVLNVPIILAANYHYLQNIPQIITDSQAIAQLAYDHFKEKGFRHFAYCGFNNMPWSEQRYTCFLEAGNFSKSQVSLFESRSSVRMQNRDAEYTQIAKWLKTLPKPIGIFCCNDDRGYDVIEACMLAGFEVPYEVAVLGVDNDPQVCDLCNPLLSSISLSTREAGFKAAETLAGLINGQPEFISEIVVKPVGVMVRQSTDVLALEDEEVAKALSYIYSSLPDNISVDDVADATTLSRRALEVRFRKALHITIAGEIQRVRIDNAKQLLRETDYSISRISEMTGYSSTPYFSGTFSKITGHTPIHYRKSFRSS